MPSPSSVLTLGLGSWGSASEVLTLGYGLAADGSPGGGAVDADTALEFMTTATASIGGGGGMIGIGSDHYVKYYGAQDAETEDYLNSGTCTFSLQEEDGTELATGTLSYVAGSNGNYRGVLDSTTTATLVDGTRYVLVITFDQGAYEDVRTLYYRAGYRGKS